MFNPCSIRGSFFLCRGTLGRGVAVVLPQDLDQAVELRPEGRLCNPDQALQQRFEHVFPLGERDGDSGTRTLDIVSAADNLIKGGAGQAIQNMNLMLGLSETASLEDPGPWP